MKNNYFLPRFKLEQLQYWQETYRFNIFIFFLDTQNPFDDISESASRYEGTEKFLNCWLFFFTVLNSTRSFLFYCKKKHQREYKHKGN